MMRSSSARQRKTGTRKHNNNYDDKDSSQFLPLAAPQATSPVRQVAVERSVKNQKQKRRRFSLQPKNTFFLAVIIMLVVLSILLIVIDIGWVRYSLSSFPRYHRLQLVNPTVPIKHAKIALVSIHKGWKYHGLLGSFLQTNKHSYANLHEYAYIEPVDYEKPRFLLDLMEEHKDNLEWLLWMDGDTIITHPYISIEERITAFQNELQKTTSKEMCLVWAKKDTMPNAGVMLIHNSPTSRELFRTALQTWDETDTVRGFTDQASLTAAIDRNATYQECSLLLEESVLLQSRVRGTTNGLWKAGHWILHLPNHNYLELLHSLKLVGRTLRISPPPIVPPLERPSIETLPTKRKDRFIKVQQAIRHAWDGYSRICLHREIHHKKLLGSHIPCDDLSPIAGAGHDWLYHAATLYDSLDTLAIAFGADSHEYQQGLQVVLQQDLQATALRPTKTFEYSLRVVGGLLGAFSVTGDGRLLARAKDAVDSLLQSPFASSPTDLPRMYGVLFPPRGGNLFYSTYSKLYDWGRDTFTNEHHFNSLAGIGSFALEFHYVSQLLGDEKYRSSADKIFRHVSQYKAPDGTIPSQWNVMTGDPINSNGGLGSGSDSFVEYLLKVTLLYCKAGGDFSLCVQGHPIIHDMLAVYETIIENSLRPKHVVSKKGSNGSIAFPTDNMRYHQLLCFLPGMIALGASTKGSASAINDELNLAKQLIEGCHVMYQQSSTGLGPEEARLSNKASDILPQISDPSYLLRPEYIESIFVLYRLTGDNRYQEMGWTVFESLERYCKRESGYTGLKDINNPGKGPIDDMPSYFIAETLKYFLLLFGPDNFLSLDEFVMTTEAHPLRRRLDAKGMSTYFRYIKEEVSDSTYIVPAPFGRHIFAFLFGSFFVVVGVIASTTYYSGKKSSCSMRRK